MQAARTSARAYPKDRSWVAGRAAMVAAANAIEMPMTSVTRWAASAMSARLPDSQAATTSAPRATRATTRTIARCRRLLPADGRGAAGTGGPAAAVGSGGGGGIPPIAWTPAGTGGRGLTGTTTGLRLGR